jgi:hypothetical protein
MLVCARALVWLTFCPDIELASLLRTRHTGTAVHACPEVRMCVRVSVSVRVRARATASACVRACNDGRGVGRSRTARFARVPRYSPACVFGMLEVDGRVTA